MWTLGNLYNYYERWVVIPRKLECGEPEKLEEIEKKLEEFKEYLRTKNFKKYDDYYFVVRKFVQWLLSRGVNDLNSISDETINEYLEGLNVKPSTKGTYKSWLKKFLEFLKHTPQE
jgi:site-specific recombinase XerD